MYIASKSDIYDVPKASSPVSSPVAQLLVVSLDTTTSATTPATIWFTTIEDLFEQIDNTIRNVPTVKRMCSPCLRYLLTRLCQDRKERMMWESVDSHVARFCVRTV